MIQKEFLGVCVCVCVYVCVCVCVYVCVCVCVCVCEGIHAFCRYSALTLLSVCLCLSLSHTHTHNNNNKQQTTTNSSPRAWWTLRLPGRHNVYVLDGGLPAWISKGMDTQSGDDDIHESSSSLAQTKMVADLINTYTKEDEGHVFREKIASMADVKEFQQKIATNGMCVCMYVCMCVCMYVCMCVLLYFVYV